MKLELTFYNDQVAENQYHGVAWEDEVPTVDMLAIDGETKARHDLEDPVHNLTSGNGVVELHITVVLRVSGGKNCHDHGDGSVAIQQADNNTDTTD